MTKEEIAKHVFARNPQIDELFIASDGQAFEKEHQADAHSQRHVDKSVISLKRDEVMLEEIAKAQEADEAAKAKEAQEAEEAAKALPVVDPKEVKSSTKKSNPKKK